jgi:GT2 family glycosyltransferase
MMSVTAVVVTYNRKKLLLECLGALSRQTLPPKCIVVIDNASNDGTYELLTEHQLFRPSSIKYHRMENNAGGAGGFSYGLQLAISNEADWIWMMDDDAIPHSSALNELMKIAVDPNNIYGSTPSRGDIMSWGAMVLTLQNDKIYVEKADDMPNTAEVVFLPFLGILIHRTMVAKIGLPDPGFFIAADDVEYTLRAKKIGAKLIQAGKSKIDHPLSLRYQVNILGHTIYCLKLPPWKRYYDTRNRLLIAHKHYGIRLLTETLPGSFVRLWGALVYEPQKRLQIWSFLAGTIDGLLGKKGLRHSVWRIPV